MNNKTFGLISAGILAIFLFASFVSATITFGSIPELSPYENNFTFEISSNENETINISIAPIVQDTQTITFQDSTITVTAGTSTSVPINYVTTGFDFEFGKTYSTTMTAEGNRSAEEAHTTVSFKRIDFCEDCENHGELKIDIEDVTVLDGFGDDDDYWYLMDEIEIELKIENDGEWDIDDIEIEWVIYTTNGQKIMDDTLSDFNLKDGKDETKILTIKLDEDIDEFENEDAVFYVKAKGTIDDNGSPYDGEETCDSDSFEVDVFADDDFVILTDFKINGVKLNNLILDSPSIYCGQELTITAEVWNIGSDDQEDVTVLIHNVELGINQEVEIGDVDAFEGEDLSITITMPEEIEEKWYFLDFYVYDEDHDIFENSEDDEAEFEVKFKIEGNCQIAEPLITAELISEAKENSELEIKVTITNMAKKDATFTLNAAGYTEWASLIEISEKEVEIEAGKSKEIIIKFQTTKDSAGERFFNFEVVSEENLVTSQPIAVMIEESKGATGFTDFVKTNWKILGIGLLNLILVIAIIIVAVRAYRK